MNINRYFKTEGNIIYHYPDEHILTWGPFYFHSLDKAKAKMGEIMQMIINWVNEQDKTLNIQPENIFKAKNGKQIVFNIKAWRDNEHLEECNGIITVNDIFFEDE